jgi:hypothetical protein
MLSHCRLFIYVFLSMLLSVILHSPSLAQDGTKVAVLYFTDHSRFDSRGGCLSIWPLSAIFGSGQKREKWELKSGFRDMLNERLSEAGYNIVEIDDVDNALQEKGKENLAALAGDLDADVMIIGDIRKFEQHRMRARSQGPTTLSNTGDMRMVAMGGVGGFYYSSTVRTDVSLYDNSGDEMERAEIRSKKDLQDFYMGVGPMMYHKGDTKEETEGSQKQNPIVDYKKLDATKFGSDEFKTRTLFGMATMDVMDQVVDKVEEYLEPAKLMDVKGKILYVGTGQLLKENEVYIDLGAGDGIRAGHRLGIYAEGLELTDPDTGEKLGVVAEEKVGTLRVSKVEADHVSIAEVIEKTSKIEKGNVVKRD